MLYAKQRNQSILMFKNLFFSIDKGMSHSYVPDVTSTRDAASRDVSWQELRQTPSVQHHTPDAVSLNANPLLSLKKAPRPVLEVRISVTLLVVFLFGLFIYTVNTKCLN